MYQCCYLPGGLLEPVHHSVFHGPGVVLVDVKHGLVVIAVVTGAARAAAHTGGTAAGRLL